MKDWNDIINELGDIYERKNADYGNSFDESMRRWGLLSPIIRLSDKINRLDNLRICAGANKVRDESIRDTLLDIANYAILTIKYIDNNEFNYDNSMWKSKFDFNNENELIEKSR